MAEPHVACEAGQQGISGCNSGFTVLELVIVIVITGVLVSMALPRFLGVSDEAYDAIIEQTASSIQLSAANTRIKWLLDGKPQGASTNQGPQVDLDGQLVRVDPSLGYPVGNGGADNVDSFSLADCITIVDDMLSHSFSMERRNQVDLTTYKNFDIIVSRTNNNPDICNYYWSYSLSSIPNNGAPNQGNGFRYFSDSGTTSRFTF